MNQKVVICGVNTSNLPIINDNESEVLLKEIKSGNNSSRERFIQGNMRLVLSIVKRFWSKRANVDDIFQSGCIGLIKAIDNFDLSFCVKFSTYAVPMIIGEIKRFLRDGNSLRISRSIRDTAFQVLKTREKLEIGSIDNVTVDEIANDMNVAVSEVVYALDAISDTVSLYDTVYNKSGDTFIVLDQIGDNKNTDENWLEHVALESAMKNLDDREKRIVTMRYFEGKTQTEISREVGISQAQVSRLEKSALLSIKCAME